VFNVAVGYFPETKFSLTVVALTVVIIVVTVDIIVALTKGKVKCLLVSG